MKTLSSNKTNNVESPKTPGGISKSLLTPCRRVGLSRNWKRSVSSPFISPLSGANTNLEVKQENVLRKRKKCSTEEVGQAETSCTPDKEESNEDSTISCNTPKIDTDRSSNRSLVPRKKSKILFIANECSTESDNIPQCISELNDNCSTEHTPQNSINQVPSSRLSRKNSKSKIEQLKSADMEGTLSDSSNSGDIKTLDSTKDKIKLFSKTLNVNVKEKSPNNLTKECMVVIQKKIFKNVGLNFNTDDKDSKANSIVNKISSQTLFDSDSDDVPLCNLNIKDDMSKVSNTVQKIKSSQNENFPNDNVLDEDFVDKKKVNVKKLEHKTTSTSGLKCKVKEKKIIMKPKNEPNKSVLLISSQNSNSCDDDEDFICDKRTILVKKTYDKATKPLKSKSTGSISQKDIDEIKARIESKKNLLLAKAMVNETKELRDLIKKWQTGCQTALTELLELMKRRMPEQNMEYSELLQMLKIPADLVGYDSENDCFNTPDDTNIILSGLKLY